MSERLQGISAEEIRRCLAEEQLRDWVQQQRWYASKSRSIAGIDIVESITLREDPLMLLALVQTRFATGTHELYQLPLAIALPGEVPGGQGIAHTDGWVVYDALAEPEQAHELLRRIAADDEIETDRGPFQLPSLRGIAQPGRDDQRPLDGRRAVEFLAGVRRHDRAEGVPQARTGRQSRARGPALSHLPQVPQHRGAARLVRLRGPGVRRHFGRGPGLPPRRGRRMGARARGDHPRPRHVPRAPGRPRHGHRPAPQRPRLRRGRPGLRARGAEPGGSVAAHRDRRRGHRADLPAPTRR